MHPPLPTSTLFPYTTLFRSLAPPSTVRNRSDTSHGRGAARGNAGFACASLLKPERLKKKSRLQVSQDRSRPKGEMRSEEHTSELQSRGHLVCRLLLEKKKKV